MVSLFACSVLIFIGPQLKFYLFFFLYLFISLFIYLFSYFQGDYGLTFRVLDHDDGYRELGCLQLNFAMKKRYKGWLFKI